MGELSLRPGTQTSSQPQLHASTLRAPNDLLVLPMRFTCLFIIDFDRLDHGITGDYRTSRSPPDPGLGTHKEPPMLWHSGQYIPPHKKPLSILNSNRRSTGVPPSPTLNREDHILPHHHRSMISATVVTRPFAGAGMLRGPPYWTQAILKTRATSSL